MATPPQGIIRYPGVHNVMHGSIGLGHGTAPAVCTLYIAPQKLSDIKEVGTLKFRYGSTEIDWKDCRVDFASSDIGNDGKEVWVLSIMDRRWKWKGLGQVTGYWNHKVADSETEFIKGRERDPRKLAEDCLKAWGEKNIVGLNNLPTEPRVETEWDYAKPAESLNNLLEQFNCRICLALNGRVKIVKVGKGKDLPGGGTVLTKGTVFNPPERPDEIAVVTARTLFQADLRLIAVGLDTDGEIKPINDLSYKPKGGWINIDVHKFNNINNPAHKDYAKSTVFRWYQIKTPFSLKWSSTGQSFSINSLQSILPLGDKQLQKTPALNGVNQKPLPPWVYGRFYQGRERDRNSISNNITPLPPLIDAAQGQGKRIPSFYYDSFEIDKDRGIIKFSNPTYAHIPATKAQGQQVTAADLYLRISFPLRVGQPLGFHRHEQKRKTTGKKYGTPTRFDIHDEMGLHLIQQYDQNFTIVGVNTNIAKVKKFADYYLDAIAAEYQTLTPETKSYAGFQKIELDGKIRQVVYAVAENGAATTQAAADNEELNRVPPYRFMREVEHMQNLVDKPKTPPSKLPQAAQSATLRAEQSASYTAKLIGGGPSGGSATFTGVGAG